MNIIIDKSKIQEKYNIDEMTDKGEKALDYLWGQPWLKRIVAREEEEYIDSILDLAEKICRQSEVVIVIACGTTALAIKSGLNGMTVGQEGASVIVFGDTLSSVEYSQMIKTVKNKSFSVIAVSDGEEPISMKGAFQCLKQLLVNKYGAEQSGERTYLIISDSCKFLDKEAGENNYTVIRYPKDVPGIYSGNTHGVLLPLAIAGIDIKEYVNGLYEMVSSPVWDIDGADYSMFLAAAVEEGIRSERILTYNSNLASFTAWAEALIDDNIIERHGVTMPVNRKGSEKNHFDTILEVQQDMVDIALPSFEGCSEDGSLNMLVKDQISEYFNEGNRGNNIIKITVEDLNPYTFGQLTGFFQISSEITGFLLKN